MANNYLTSLNAHYCNQILVKILPDLQRLSGLIYQAFKAPNCRRAITAVSTQVKINIVNELLGIRIAAVKGDN